MANPVQSSIFISHSSKDKPFIKKLVADLKANGCTVWLDSENIVVGDSIVWAVSGGLQKADFLILAISRSSMASEWVRQEFGAALMRQLGKQGGIKVLPIRLDNTDVPPIIADRKYADFRENYDVALQDLLQALKQPCAPPDASKPKIISSRDWVIEKLEGMIPEQLSHVITRIPSASKYVPDAAAPVTRASALLHYVESVPGPGIEKLILVIERVINEHTSPPKIALPPTGGAKSVPVMAREPSYHQTSSILRVPSIIVIVGIIIMVMGYKPIPNAVKEHEIMLHQDRIADLKRDLDYLESKEADLVTEDNRFRQEHSEAINYIEDGKQVTHDIYSHNKKSVQNTATITGIELIAVMLWIAQNSEEVKLVDSWFKEFATSKHDLDSQIDFVKSEILDERQAIERLERN